MSAAAGGGRDSAGPASRRARPRRRPPYEAAIRPRSDLDCAGVPAGADVTNRDSPALARHKYFLWRRDKAGVDASDPDMPHSRVLLCSLLTLSCAGANPLSNLVGGGSGNGATQSTTSQSDAAYQNAEI